MPLNESQARKVHRSLLRSSGLPIPPELWEPTDNEREVTAALWARYEKDKSSLPPMEPGMYERETRLIAEKIGL